MRIPVLNYLSPFLFCVYLSGCGGGGGSGSGGGDPADRDYTPIVSERESASCSLTPSSADRYDIAGYHACGGPSLSGIWLVTADYKVNALIGDQFDCVLRMTLRITEASDDQLSIKYCSLNHWAPPMTALIEKGSESFTIADPVSDSNIRFSQDGVAMTGIHETARPDLTASLQFSIDRSSVTARKLSDDSSLAIGYMDLSYVDNGRTETVSFAPVECMTQAYGDMRIGGTTHTDTEITSFVASKGSQLTTVRLIDRDNSDNFFADIYTAGYSKDSGIMIGGTSEPNDVLITNNSPAHIEIDAMFFDLNSLENDISLSVLMGF